MRSARIVQEAPKWFQADAAFADMLMSIQPGSSRGLGVVAVPDWDMVQANRVLQVLHGVLVAFWRNDVISGHMGVAGVDASRHRQHGPETVHQLRHLLE